MAELSFIETTDNPSEHDLQFIIIARFKEIGGSSEAISPPDIGLARARAEHDKGDLGEVLQRLDSMEEKSAATIEQLERFCR